MSMSILDDRSCALGEGAFWHPEQEQLFWFDILDRQLLCADGNCWQFNEYVSAGGWVTKERVIIGSASGLYTYNFKTLVQSSLVEIEADNPKTRSNDGRADPFGGFWISTMGLNAEPNLGSIYRLYKGELRQIFSKLTVPNAICFTPDGGTAFFADTAQQTIQRVSLDSMGWPIGEPEVHIDLRAENLNPDGAIITADGLLVNAQWGAARVAVYDPSGAFLHAYEVPTAHATCPALHEGVLYVTSAKQGLSLDQLAAQPTAGKTFALKTDLIALDEAQVLL